MPRTGLYVPLDVAFADDDRIEEVGLDGAGLYAMSLAVAKRAMTDGRITRTKLRRLGADDALIDRCIEVGLYREDDDGLWITAWLDHNDPVEKIEERRARDAARKRQTRAKRPTGQAEDKPRTPTGRADTVEGSRGKTEGREEPPPSQSEIATPDNRVAKRSAVIDLLTDQAIDARRSPAPIDDPDAYRSRVRAGMLTEHGDRAMQFVGSYPEWTIQRIAGELTRPDGDEDTATPKVLYAHADEQRHQRDSEALQAKANSDPTVVAEARRAAREAIHRPPAAEERSDGGETVLSLVDERSAS